MDPIFLILALITLAAAVASMTLRNLVHCALALTLVFAGLAAVYLRLNVQFIAFAQLLVYVGAVAILIVFAILLTRGGEKSEASPQRISITGLAITGLVGGSIIALIAASPAARSAVPHASSVSVKELGRQLMTDYILPLEVIGLLLTAALIGAIIIALPGTRPAEPKPSTPETSITPLPGATAAVTEMSDHLSEAKPGPAPVRRGLPLP
jgi:NADH-quinone oxidoreductase subunit J